MIHRTSLATLAVALLLPGAAASGWCPAAPVIGRPCPNEACRTREIQKALDFFGYGPGRIDGIYGSSTRRAVVAFETEMGFVPDGNLDQLERSFLADSHWLACSRRRPADKSPREFLRMLNDKRLANPVDALPPVPIVPSVAPVAPNVNPPPVTMAPAPATTDVNPLERGLDVRSRTASMSVHCARTNHYTNSNGGYITLVTAANASQALNEQFCLAREYVKQKGRTATTSIAGVTAEVNVATCQLYADALAGPLASLASQPPAAVLAEVDTIAGEIPAPRRAQVGEICMSIGYDRDNPRITLSAALLAISGERGSYGEIIGHHLREGFGTAANVQMAKDWHLHAIAAMDQGSPADVLPNQAMQRNAVILEALGDAEAE